MLKTCVRLCNTTLCYRLISGRPGSLEPKTKAALGLYGLARNQRGTATTTLNSTQAIDRGDTDHFVCFYPSAPRAVLPRWGYCTTPSTRALGHLWCSWSSSSQVLSSLDASWNTEASTVTGPLGSASAEPASKLKTLRVEGVVVKTAAIAAPCRATHRLVCASPKAHTKAVWWLLARTWLSLQDWAWAWDPTEKAAARVQRLSRDRFPFPGKWHYPET